MSITTPALDNIIEMGTLFYVGIHLADGQVVGVHALDGPNVSPGGPVTHMDVVLTEDMTVPATWAPFQHYANSPAAYATVYDAVPVALIRELVEAHGGDTGRA